MLLANQHHLNVSEVFGELAASFESYKYIGLNSLKGRCVAVSCPGGSVCVRVCVCVCVCVCACVRRHLTLTTNRHLGRHLDT